MLSASDTAKWFQSLIAGTRVTRVMLQDGFGARNSHTACTREWSVADYAIHAQEYEAQMAAIGQQWIIVEAFDHCEKGRLDRQFDVLPDNAKVIVYQYDDCVATKLCR